MRGPFWYKSYPHFETYPYIYLLRWQYANRSSHAGYQIQFLEVAQFPCTKGLVLLEHPLSKGLCVCSAGFQRLASAPGKDQRTAWDVLGWRIKSYQASVANYIHWKALSWVMDTDDLCDVFDIVFLTIPVSPLLFNSCFFLGSSWEARAYIQDLVGNQIEIKNTWNFHFQVCNRTSSLRLQRCSYQVAWLVGEVVEIRHPA